MSIKDITVVITSFRSSEKIKSCLNSIDRQCRILLVENSDDFEFKKKIEKEFANAECIITGANLGYGKGNNIGLKKVTTKYALILNPDATLHPSTLVNFLKTVEEIPEFAIMGPYLQGKKNNDEKIHFANRDVLLIKNKSQRSSELRFTFGIFCCLCVHQL